MATNYAVWFTLHVSAVLAILSLEAVTVAIFRIVRGPTKAELAPITPEQALSTTRIVSLSAFSIYLLGCAMREGVVVFAGVEIWGDTAILLSGIARLIQLFGACMFVWGITHHICGNWMWTMMLGIAMAFSVIILR